MIGQEHVEPLEWRLPPKPGEPAAGYASRLAALNNLDFVPLMRSTGISAREVHSGLARGVRNVARLGGLDAAQAVALAACTPIRPSRRRPGQLGDERLVPGAVLAGFFRFCPHCVAQDLIEAPHDVPVAARPWLRLEWSINQIRSCRTHGVRLAETRRVEDHELIVDFARTVATEVLPHLARLRAETVPTRPNAFEDWLLRRLRNERTPSNWLDTMPINAAVAACESLGIEGLGSDRPHLSKFGNEEWVVASLSGYSIASKGENAIVRFLDALAARSHAAGTVGMKSIYGYIFEVLERTLDDPGFEAFRNVVRRHAIENVPLPAGSQVLGYVLEERRLHTATSAAAASKTSHATLRAIFARSGIAPPLGGPDHQRLIIRVDAFEAQLREFGAALKVTDVREAVGIPHKHILELIARGMVPTLFGSREVHKARHRVARDDVEAFMDRLFEGAVPVEAPTPRQVTFGRACFVASTNIGDVVGLVLARRLAWKGSLRGGRRYTDLLVDADEVLALLQGAAAPRRGLMKAEIEAETPGLRLDVLTPLIAAGHLMVAQEFCPQTRRRLPVVTRESYEAFKGRYLTLTEICHAKNLNARVARRHLDAAGLVPAFDPAVFKNAIYERAGALDAALRDCPPRGAIWAASHRTSPPRRRS
ncbi:TniQ family protein [Methylorubrum extorquens]|uniref:TniQ family protein n=1 Tax=Methylorubrum extorquens TaxID=408 RepID=UPI003F5FDCE3